MAKGLYLKPDYNMDEYPEDRVIAQVPRDVIPFTCPEGNHWSLDILRLNDPFQNIRQDAMAWFTVGENHLSRFPEWPQGMFTLRMVSFNKYKTLFQLLDAGKTHGVFAFNDRKKPTEKEERALNCFLVDLRVASYGLHYADEERENPKDGNKFLIFDAMKTEVKTFCRQLRIR